jgi:hypothetical protein
MWIYSNTLGPHQVERRRSPCCLLQSLPPGYKPPLEPEKAARRLASRSASSRTCRLRPCRGSAILRSTISELMFAHRCFGRSGRGPRIQSRGGER